jgi:exodeoxyribonuclease-3
MKIVSWNVNSVRARSEHVTALLATEKPSVLCMQETKVVDDSFPHDLFKSECSINGQKSYNGVATWTRQGHTDAEFDPFGDDLGKRVVAVTYRGLRIINVYIPNGGKDEQAYVEKLAWLSVLTRWLRTQVKKYKHVVVTGDYNICHTDADVHDPKSWKDRVCCTDAERGHFNKFLGLGFVDAYRELYKDDTDYTWFDYRSGAFGRNKGLRIDYFLITKSLLPYLKDCKPLREYRGMGKPSDHVPLLLELVK